MQSSAQINTNEHVFKFEEKVFQPPLKFEDAASKSEENAGM